MLDDELVELLGEYLAETYRAVDKHYLELLGRQIREIGAVGPTGLHQLRQMMRTGANVNAITRELADITGQNAEDIARILEQAAQSAYGDAAPYYEARGVSQAPLAANPALLNTVRAIEAVTLQAFANLSQTTAVRQSYSKAIDSAVAAVQSGVTDYNKAIRGALREAAKEGLRVEYASGHTRRLDSAVRQNVLDGVRAVNQGVRDETGRQFGADGVEIQAHGMSAPDHEPHQGRQYSKKEFAALQGSLPRPIGMWNCGHAVFPIILGVSAPNYTRRELREMREDNHTPVTYIGKTYATKYEASQQQRRMETTIRYGEDVAHLADAAGDTALAAEYRAKLKVLNREYRDFSGTAGLQTRRDRIQAARQRFASGGGGGTMGPEKATRAVQRAAYTNKATFKDASEWAQSDLGIQYLKNYHVDVANALNREIDNAYSVFGNLHDKKALNFVTMDAKRFREATVAAYAPSSGTLLMRTGKGALADAARDAKESYAAGFWSTSAPEHAIRHEIGHSVGKAYLTPAKQAEIESLRQGLVQETATNGVWTLNDKAGIANMKGVFSYYGLHNVDDMIAESVAEYLGDSPRTVAVEVVEILMRGNW